MKRDIRLMGILNVTPDSFSDGNRYFDVPTALAHGKQLFNDGADVVDIGGDSTRPNSTCVGVEEEWKRIKNLIAPLSKIGKISVDTHHGEIARRAILEGASIVNDVSGGSDPTLLSAVSKSSASIMLMHSATKAAHSFLAAGGVIDDICRDVNQSFDCFLKIGNEYAIPNSRLILDPGMSAFISNEPKDSYRVLQSFSTLASYGCALGLGCSRKGFLRSSAEHSVSERDGASVLCVLAALQDCSNSIPYYIRVHNVALHKASFERWFQN